MAKQNDKTTPAPTAIATVSDETSLAYVPDYMAKDARGKENLTADDLTLPRLALAQAMSPQVTKGKPEYIKGLEVGQMFNNLTGEIYGEGPLQFTVLRRDPPRGIEFGPNVGDPIVDMNVPANDPRMQFTMDDQGRSVKPKATKFYDFIVMILPSREIMALSFKSTGLKVAKQLNSLISLRPVACFGGRYVLTTAMMSNAKGTFATFKVGNAGVVNAEEYAYGEQMFEMLKDKTVNFEREREETDEAPTTTEY
jgi:hypothetical protein